MPFAKAFSVSTTVDGSTELIDAIWVHLRDGEALLVMDDKELIAFETGNVWSPKDLDIVLRDTVTELYDVNCDDWEDVWGSIKYEEYATLL